MTRFEQRAMLAELCGVPKAHRHNWPRYLEATEAERGWSLMRTLIGDARCHLARWRQHRDAGRIHLRRQSAHTLRGIVRHIQRLERGERSALTAGLPACINGVDS